MNSSDAQAMRHTPGPWSFDHDWRRLPTIFAADGKTKVAIIERIARGTRTPAQEANANLIAAAPDLLAALKRLVADVLIIERQRHPIVGLDDARAAIAKAEGREP